MKRGQTPTQHPERGAAMLLVVVMMGVFAVMGTAYWRHLNATLDHTRDHAKAQVARELAEAGIARAIAELRAGNADFETAEGVTLGAGVYSVSLAPAQNGAREVNAMGALTDGKELRRTVRIRASIHLDATGRPARVAYLRETS